MSTKKNSSGAPAAPESLNPEDYKRHTATHEAGHVVAYIRHNEIFEHATILPGKDGSWGLVVGGEEPWTKKKAKAKVSINLGGYAACIAAGDTEDQAVFGCGTDFNNAQERIDAWQLGTLSEAKAKAVKFMRRRKNVRAVELVAQHLLLHGKLETWYLGVLVSLADGETTPAEFDQFLVFRADCMKSREKARKATA